MRRQCHFLTIIDRRKQKPYYLRIRTCYKRKLSDAPCRYRWNGLIVLRRNQYSISSRAYQRRLGSWEMRIISHWWATDDYAGREWFVWTNSHIALVSCVIVWAHTSARQYLTALQRSAWLARGDSHLPIV